MVTYVVFVPTVWGEHQRHGTQVHAEQFLNFRLNSRIDLIGDQNDIQIL